MHRVLLLLALAAPVHANSSYEGEARSPDTDVLLYEEHHMLRSDGGVPQERIVLYRCPDGAAFARKHVRYARDPAAPTFALHDARFGYREGVRRTGGALEAFYQPDAGSPEREARLVAGDALVIDAGFDEFVRAQWDELQAGRRVALEFLVPSRLETLGFTLRKLESRRIADQPVSVFRLSLGGVLGWFAPDIDVSYREYDRRLMRFEGLTNIRRDSRGNLSARIDFPPTRERSGIEPGAWERAEREPLVDCAPGA